MTALPYVDGNMLDGPLGEVFAVDLSTATARCANCGTPGPVAGCGSTRTRPAWWGAARPASK